MHIPTTLNFRFFFNMPMLVSPETLFEYRYLHNAKCSHECDVTQVGSGRYPLDGDAFLVAAVDVRDGAGGLLAAVECLRVERRAEAARQRLVVAESRFDQKAPDGSAAQDTY